MFFNNLKVTMLGLLLSVVCLPSCGGSDDGGGGNGGESEAEGTEGEAEAEAEGSEAESESESEGGCQAQNCDDGDPCTTDAWDEAQCACTHTSPSEDCDDGVDCTDDSFNGDLCACVHELVHARCPVGTICDAMDGCVSPPPCATVDDCPDLGTVCLVPRCNAATATCAYDILDGDGDGHAPQICDKVGGDDCDDADPYVHPGAPEQCNGQDDDCDGVVDGEMEACGYYPIGVCMSGTALCTSGSLGPCVGSIGPTSETCDGLDNDCNGTADDGSYADFTGWETSCSESEYGSSHPWVCSAGVPVECDCCNGVDDDGDGEVDSIDSDCPTSDYWCLTSDTGVTDLLLGVDVYTSIWTGSEMIVWGGCSDTCVGDRYNPATNIWTATTTAGAPSARVGHTAIWTGSEMIVWGGYGTAPLNTGSRYNPSTNSWTATSTASAPSARYAHTAIWTGSEMIVWGGQSDTAYPYLGDGAKYNPSTNTWTPMASAGAGRSYHSAVWTGSEMLVWGGERNTNLFNEYPPNGGRYDPIANQWAPMIVTGAPTGRSNQTAVWTGSKLIVWGGLNEGSVDDPTDTEVFGDGAAYNPSLNQWTPVASASAPTARYNHTAVWTGSEMIVWGGSSSYTSTGGRYDPLADAWTTTSLSVPEVVNYYCNHNAVWTGSEMIMINWACAGGLVGARYIP